MNWRAFQMEAAMSVKRWESTNLFKGLRDTKENRVHRARGTGRPGARSCSTLEGMVMTLAFLLTALENTKKVLRRRGS